MKTANHSFKVVEFRTRGKGVVTLDTIFPGNVVGLYLSKDLEPITEGRVLYDGWIESNPIGRYVNHNNSPNCNVSLDGNNISLVSCPPRFFTSSNNNGIVRVRTTEKCLSALIDYHQNRPLDEANVSSIYGPFGYHLDT